MIRTSARFESTLRRPQEGASGAGELAALLVAGIRAKGFSPSPIKDQEYAHTFRCKSGEYDYEVMVAFDFADGGTWEISCPPALGWFATLRGKSEERELSALISAIASVLHSEARVKNVRWYQAYGDKSAPSPTP